jgi:hypothetical protein
MSLTIFLQQKFVELIPHGWIATSEVPLLSPELAQILGYAPRVDVVLINEQKSSRYWIEFEISRADPVANHAKFATAHLFQPQIETDIFCSMVSSHVARGRHNLAANAIFLMRRIGMRAFQTVLFPTIAPSEIKQLNHMPVEHLWQSKLDVLSELERVFSISTVTEEMFMHKIIFSSNYSDVTLNIFRWNEDLKATEDRALWGKRTVTYFVFDPQSKLFAPSKFCAYLPSDLTTVGMSVKLYASLDSEEKRFDGYAARKHLVDTLCMLQLKPDDIPQIQPEFDKWLNLNQDTINLHPSGHYFIVPPRWYS